MNAHDIITEARAHGVDLWADGEALGYRGNPESITALLPEFKAHKPELLEILAGNPSLSPANDAPDLPEFGPPDPAPADEWQRRIWAGWQYNRGKWLQPGQWKPAEPQQAERAPTPQLDPEDAPTGGTELRRAIPTARPLVTVGMVTCGACRNWTPPPGDGAGKCGKGVKPTLAQAPLCRSTPRYCQQFQPINASTRSRL